MKPSALLILTLIAVVTLMVAFGCKDATRAQWNSLGKPHKITLWSGGIAVHVYHSTGNVSNSENSDGWYFEDRDTGKLVELTGTIQIEQE